MRHLLEIDDLEPKDLDTILGLSKRDLNDQHRGQGVALIFEMPSARTRNAAEMAAFQLGMHPVYIEESELGFDQRETAEDIVRTLACYHSVVCARLHDDSTLARMAATDEVPVVNLLSRTSHPMQALADLLTIRQEFGDVEGLTLAYLGHPNNVWRSLSMAAGMAGMTVRLGTPDSLYPSEDDLARIKRCGAEVEVTADAEDAVFGADVVYTDKWVSMSDRDKATNGELATMSVTGSLMENASDHAIFLHCLPAKRGEEVTTEVIDGPRSRVWEQAANRMHTTRGVFSWLLS